MNIVAITPDRERYIEPTENFLNYPLRFQKTLDWEEFESLTPQAAIFLADCTSDLSQFVEKC